MIRHAYHRPTTRFPRRARAAAAMAAALTLAIVLAAPARTENTVLNARSPKAPPALDARMDGVPATCGTAQTSRVKARALDPAAVRAGAASTAPSVARAASPAAASREARFERPAVIEARAEKATARDARPDKATTATREAGKTAALDDDGRDVLADLGRELIELGRWLTTRDWE